MARSNALGHTPAMDLLLEPRLNNSTVFADDECERLGLTGLLPDVVESDDLQLKRVLQQLGRNTPRRRSNYVPDGAIALSAPYARLRASATRYGPNPGRWCLRRDLARHDRGARLYPRHVHHDRRRQRIRQPDPARRGANSAGCCRTPSSGQRAVTGRARRLGAPQREMGMDRTRSGHSRGELGFLRRLATALRQPLRFFLPPLK